MAFDNTKYDVELDGTPLRVTAYQKSELSTFIPRFGSGEQTESEFNLLRARTIKSFEGGQLQQNWLEDNQVHAVENMYPIYDDGVLYPVNTFASATDIMGKATLVAKAETADYLFLGIAGFSGAEGVTRITKATGAITAITVPATLSGGTYEITDMVIWRNQLWVCANKAAIGSMYYMATTATTLTEVPAGAGAFHRMVVWKDQLYGTNGGLISPNFAFYRYSGDTATRSFLNLASTPAQFGSFEARLFVYNNRIYLSRNDGLYAWDGVNLVTIEDLTKMVDEENFRFPTIMKGYLYYFMPDGMYRFNGSLIEKLYPRSEVGYPVDMTAGKNRIWIAYANYEGNSSRYDKSMGYDYNTGNSIDGRVAVFDGKGMFTYGRTSTFVKNPGTDDIANQGRNHRVVWYGDKLYVFTYFDKQGAGTYYYLSTNEQTGISGNKSWRIVSSIFDADFPMVDKNLDNIELVFDGNVSSDQAITLEYRIGGFDGSTGWASLGSFQSQTELKRYIWKTLSAGLTFRKIQFRLTGTTAYSYGIAKLIVRYVLTPDFKWQWNLTALCYGDEGFAPLINADGTESTLTVAQQRGAIYAARDSDTPVLFIDADQLDLNGAINAAVTSVVLNSTALIKGSEGFIQIDDEIMYFTAKTATTLTVVRGVLGTTPAVHADNAKVFLVYRVYVRTIANERMIIQDNQEDLTEDKSRSTEISLALQEV